jgi:trimeric autotransporter adhesin
MKRRLWAARIACAFAAACGGGGDSSPTSPPTVASLTINTPSSTSLAGGATIQLVATAKDQNGNVMNATVTWSSSDATHATVSPSGLVQGLLAGTASITAAAGSVVSPPVSLTIIPGPAAKIARQRDVATGIVVATSDSIAVRITDGGGNPVAGTAVLFGVTTGGGTLSVASSTSGTDGVAGVRWTLGTIAGAQAVTATAGSLSGSPLAFNAVAVAGPAATMTKISTDPASVPVFWDFDSLKVKVQDQFGNPKSGEIVNFAVTQGGGSVSPATVTTGSDGLAASAWTMGSVSGAASTATATRSGLPVQTFSTVTTPPVVSTVTVAPPRLVVLDSGATLAFTPTARDIKDHVIADAVLTAASRSPAATVAGGAIAGAHRGSTFVVATSVQTPSASDSMFVTVGAAGGPVVITDLARVDIKHDTTLTIAVVVDMRGNPAKLGAATIQVTWPTALLTYQSDADGTAGVGASVNTASAASGSLTLSLANSTGFGGAVQVRRITFHAASAVGVTGKLSLFVTELAAAGSFASLTSSTVAGTYPLITR